MVFPDVLCEPCGTSYQPTTDGGKDDFEIEIAPSQSWNSTTAAHRSKRLLAPWEQNNKKKLTRSKSVREVVDWTTSTNLNTSRPEAVVRDPSFIDKLEKEDLTLDEITKTKVPFHYRLVQQYKRRALQRNRELMLPTVPSVIDKKEEDDNDNTVLTEPDDSLSGDGTPEDDSAKSTQKGEKKSNVKAADESRRKKRVSLSRFASFRPSERSAPAVIEEEVSPSNKGNEEQETERKVDVVESTHEVEVAQKSEKLDETSEGTTETCEENTIDKESKKSKDEGAKRNETTEEVPSSKKKDDEVPPVVIRNKKRLSFKRFASLRNASGKQKNKSAVAKDLPEKTVLNEDELRNAKENLLREILLQEMCMTEQQQRSDKQTENDVDAPEDDDVVTQDDAPEDEDDVRQRTSSPVSTAEYLLDDEDTMDDRTLSLLIEMGLSPATSVMSPTGSVVKQTAAGEEPAASTDKGVPVLEEDESSATTRLMATATTNEEHRSDVSHKLEEKTKSVMQEIGSMMEHQEQQLQRLPSATEKTAAESALESMGDGLEIEFK